MVLEVNAKWIYTEERKETNQGEKCLLWVFNAVGRLFSLFAASCITNREAASRLTPYVRFLMDITS